MISARSRKNGGSATGDGGLLEICIEDERKFYLATAERLMYDNQCGQKIVNLSPAERFVLIGSFLEMAKIITTKVTNSVYFVSIPEADIHILCGCPADSIKHLIKKGLILTKDYDGVVYETGPNVVLLSDVLVQNGMFCNLAEFPVLQMLYRQGMILPNHPNNTGVKPMIIGSVDQVKAQLQYIYRGNYGLISEDEIREAGIPAETAHDFMRLKLKFAFGKIHQPDELIDTRIIGDKAVEIRNGVFIHRLQSNVFEITYQDEAEQVDLNLAANETYGLPYPLNYQYIRRQYFAVVHSGEGDGWNVDYPCMSSIILFQGRIYLIDAGPDVMASLLALGISVNEVEGVFHTHAHDDHFAGFTTLMRTDHRIKYYATPLVRVSVAKKLAALMNFDESDLFDYFEVHDLEFDVWNDIEGLEVKPIFSPHPVETSIFVFRTLWDNGYRSYAHFADIVSLDVLKGMITDDPNENGVSAAFYARIREHYLTRANLKKIDIGGGLIHGNVIDFKNDRSDKIILSHNSKELTHEQKELGSGAPFGMTDVLIPANSEYDRSFAAGFLKTFFPAAPDHQLLILLNNPVMLFNPGAILIKDRELNQNIYLILTGSIEWIRTDIDQHYMLSAGALIGSSSAMDHTVNQGVFRAFNCVRAMCLPVSIYLHFIKNNRLYDEIRSLRSKRECLQMTWLFGEVISYPVQWRIARVMQPRTYSQGYIFPNKKRHYIYLIAEGRVVREKRQRQLETLQPGDFFGEEGVLFQHKPSERLRTIEFTRVYLIPAQILLDIPVVRWKLYETYQKRKAMKNA